MSSPSLAERLSQHRTLATVPPEEIAWIAEHGALHSLEAGDVLTHKDGPVEGLHIVLSGHLSIYVESGTGRRKVMEWRAGDVTGVMPYSRLVSPPGSVTAEQPSEVVTIYRKDMPGLIHACQTLTGILVHVMLDRARVFTSSFLHDEKLVSLGKLSAGFAHELNNPASAIARAAAALSNRLEMLSAAARKIGAVGLNPEQTSSLSLLFREGRSGGTRTVLSPIAREEREDEFAAWLGRHGLGDAPAESLADSGIELENLNRVASQLSGPALEAAIEWLAAACATEQLTREIQQASARGQEGIVVRVVDNGPGVPANIRDRIFEPFFTTKPVGKGTGLGLDIVRRLVQRHNGQIELDSVPGRTEFRVTIPFA
jgi:signal transduction histidine kinase